MCKAFMRTDYFGVSGEAPDSPHDLVIFSSVKSQGFWWLVSGEPLEDLVIVSVGRGVHLEGPAG